MSWLQPEPYTPPEHRAPVVTQEDPERMARARRAAAKRNPRKAAQHLKSAKILEEQPIQDAWSLYRAQVQEWKHRVAAWRYKGTPRADKHVNAAIHYATKINDYWTSLRSPPTAAEPGSPEAVQAAKRARAAELEAYDHFLHGGSDDANESA